MWFWENQAFAHSDRRQGRDADKLWAFPRRSLWTSTSSYKSDLVANLPKRPSNVMAYLFIFAGVCGLLLALFVGANGTNAGGFAILCLALSILCPLASFEAKKGTRVLVMSNRPGTTNGFVLVVVTSGKHKIASASHVSAVFFFGSGVARRRHWLSCGALAMSFFAIDSQLISLKSSSAPGCESNGL